MGGNTAKIARDDLERKLKDRIVTNNNKLNYQYIDDKKIDNYQETKIKKKLES